MKISKMKWNENGRKMMNGIETLKEKLLFWSISLSKVTKRLRFCMKKWLEMQN